MKYIRTKDGIYDYDEIYDARESYTLRSQGTKEEVFNFVYHLMGGIKQANNIKELICDDDILYIHDLYPDAVLVVEGNIKPFGYQTAIKLKEWLEYKLEFDLYIKDSNGNYIKRAKTNDKGELELL